MSASREEKVREALTHIIEVLGEGAGKCSVNQCDGCKYEMAEAARAALSALDGEGRQEPQMAAKRADPYTVVHDALGDGFYSESKVAVDALRGAGLLASGGAGEAPAYADENEMYCPCCKRPMGEAPAGLTRGEARAAHNAMQTLRRLYPSTLSSSEFDSAQAKLAALRGLGEPPATDEAEDE